MDLGIAGKVALVGGGSEGMGRGTAEVLAEEGAKIAIYGLDDEALVSAREELSRVAGEEVLAIACDVRSSADCERAVAETVARFGGLDLMVTNMAGSFGTPFPEDDEGWAAAWEMWAMGPMRLIRYAVPAMRRRGAGSIVNITSCGVHQLLEETRFTEIPRLALTGYSKYRANELAAEGIRINNVLPGWVMTPRAQIRFEAVAAERGIGVDEVAAEEASPIPMGRFATTREIGQSIAFLLSDAAAYVTGTNFRIDGGWCLDPTH
jgi:3-oxoacyl-[acyl-carrier protein] reductase